MLTRSLLVVMFVSALLSGRYAEAAVVINLVPRIASPGDVVAVRSTGQSPPRGGYFDLFLAPSQKVADGASGPADPRLVRVARLMSGNPRSERPTFTVPDVPPGRYVIVGFCKACGAKMFSAVGKGLVVTASAPLPRTGTGPGMLMVGGLSLLFIGLICSSGRWGAFPRLRS